MYVAQFIDDRKGAVMDPANRAVRAQQPELQIEIAMRLLRQGLTVPRAVLWMNRLDPGVCVLQQTFRGTAPDLLINWADIANPPGEAIGGRFEKEKHHVDVFGQLPETLLALAQRRLRALAFPAHFGLAQFALHCG